MMITFSSPDEVIVTTKENEPETVKAYFTEGGRNIQDYDREETDDLAIAITSRLMVR